MISVSDATGYGTLLGVGIVALMQQINAYKAERSRARVAASLEEAKQKAAVGADVGVENGRKLDEIRDQTSQVHKLVNGQHTALLRALALSARRLADHTHSNDDLALADKAEAALAANIE